jgi:hypothetical protein
MHTAPSMIRLIMLTVRTSTHLHMKTIPTRGPSWKNLDCLESLIASTHYKTYVLLAEIFNFELCESISVRDSLSTQELQYQLRQTQKILFNIIHLVSDMVKLTLLVQQPSIPNCGENSTIWLDTIIIDDMPDTPISFLQLCEGGNTENKCCCFLPQKELEYFPIWLIRKALQIMDLTVQILRGFCDEGVYIQKLCECQHKHTDYSLAAKFRPKSMYDHIQYHRSSR